MNTDCQMPNSSTKAERQEGGLWRSDVEKLAQQEHED